MTVSQVPLSRDLIISYTKIMFVQQTSYSGYPGYRDTGVFKHCMEMDWFSCSLETGSGVYPPLHSRRMTRLIEYLHN